MNAEEWVNYQSPFDTNLDTAKYSSGHWEWCFDRRLYAETGKRHHLDEMLKNVTMDNPPDAPRLPRLPEIPSAVYFAIIIGIGLTVAGGFGGLQAVVAVAVVLALVFFAARFS